MKRTKLIAIAVFFVVPALFASACASPLASRRARVAEPGTLEISASPYLEATAFRESDSTTFAPFVFPYGEASARFGLVDRVDMQVKIDPTLIPEVSVGYQVLGDPKKNDFAVTLSAGVKPGLFDVGGMALGDFSVPLEAIVDVPLDDKNDAFVFGTRTIASVGVIDDKIESVLSPGAFAAFHFQTGRFFVHPEIAANAHWMPFNSWGIGTVNAPTVVAALGVGMVLDFRQPLDPDPAHGG